MNLADLKLPRPLGTLAFVAAWFVPWRPAFRIRAAESGLAFFVHHRDHPGARTLAERVLAGELPEAERMLLVARVEGRIGIWRVESVEGPLIAFADILSDEQRSVQDGPRSGEVT